jgi:hypothetical protein
MASDLGRSEQAIGFPAQGRKKPTANFGTLRGTGLQDVDRTSNGREWRAQLVAGVGHERVANLQFAANPVSHVTERLRELREFIASAGLGEDNIEVPVGDGPRRCGEQSDWAGN